MTEYPKFIDRIKFYDADGFDHMVSVGADDPDELFELVGYTMEQVKTEGGQPTRADSRPAGPQAPADSGPKPAVRAGGQRPKADSNAVKAYGDTYEIQYTTTGKKIAKIKCEAPELAGIDEYDGNWQRYGVTAWPEVLETIGIADPEEHEAGEYRLPAEVEHIRVLYKDGKPKKVLGFHVSE